jgi:hypothetical protein
MFDISDWVIGIAYDNRYDKTYEYICLTYQDNNVIHKPNIYTSYKLWGDSLFYCWLDSFNIEYRDHFYLGNLRCLSKNDIISFRNKIKYVNMTMIQSILYGAECYFPDNNDVVHIFDCPYEELINHINYLNDEVKRIRKLVLFA